MKLTHGKWLGWIALAVAWCFDFLFWQKAPGISFFIFVLICIVAGGVLTRREGQRPAGASLLLIPPVLFFAVMTFIREEQAATFFNVLLTLTCLTVLVLTWQGGKWLQYSLSDYVVGFFRLFIDSLTRGAQLLFTHQKSPAPVAVSDVPAVSGIESQVVAATDPKAPKAAQPSRQQTVAVLRGVLLALPVVAILAALLAQADPVFSRELSDFLRLFRIEKLGEYIFRAIYICAFAYVLIGIYFHALGPSREEKLVGLEKPWLPPFLGSTEAAIILGSVDILFAFFVAIQFRYFFGGTANIKIEGYTFSEYARRGFGELVGVAVISLLLFLGLNAITKRQTVLQRKVFSGLGIGLVLLVAVILDSAFQRLLLYETAYSFTRLRTYTHIFMVWVGVLLLATVVLELLGRSRSFGLALLLVAIGFGITVNVVNVDSLIVHQNTFRSSLGVDLDTQYLASLSDDAVPALFAELQAPGQPAKLRQEVGVALICFAEQDSSSPAQQHWQSFHLSRSLAARLFSQNQALLMPYTAWRENSIWHVRVDGQNRTCTAPVQRD
jgi:hypothetical protein